MGLSWLLVAAYAAGLVALYLLGWLLLVPSKIMSKIMLNAVVGGVLLVVISMVSGIFHMTISVNAVTALIAGILGVPGVALVVFLPMIL